MALLLVLRLVVLLVQLLVLLWLLVLTSLLLQVHRPEAEQTTGRRVCALARR